jgi:ABC-2 type transport system ATP-binding protein
MSALTTPVAPTIDIRDLRVDYGDFIAVDDLSLQIQPGEVLGLVGPNGAGKTSTFRVLATLIEPTYGEVRLGGIDIFEHTAQARRILGYMPDLAPVPSDLQVAEMLHFYARCYHIGTAAERNARVDECLALTHMEEKRNSWCKELSRGQTQRAILAKTLLHDPKVLVLDEPASGLDPLSRRHLRLILADLAARGATIVISSHILAELAEMCSSLCVMNRGKKLADGPVDAVRQQLGQSQRALNLTLLSRQDEARAWLASEGASLGVLEVTSTGDLLGCTFGGSQEDQATLIERMIASGFRLTSFEERKSSFEEILIGIAQQPSRN